MAMSIPLWVFIYIYIYIIGEGNNSIGAFNIEGQAHIDNVPGESAEETENVEIIISNSGMNEYKMEEGSNKSSKSKSKTGSIYSEEEDIDINSIHSKSKGDINNIDIDTQPITIGAINLIKTYTHNHDISASTPKHSPMKTGGGTGTGLKIWLPKPVFQIIRYPKGYFHTQSNNNVIDMNIFDEYYTEMERYKWSNPYLRNTKVIVPALPYTNISNIYTDSKTPTPTPTPNPIEEDEDNYELDWGFEGIAPFNLPVGQRFPRAFLTKEIVQKYITLPVSGVIPKEEVHLFQYRMKRLEQQWEKEYWDQEQTKGGGSISFN